MGQITQCPEVKSSDHMLQSNCAKCNKELTWPTYKCKFCNQIFCSKDCQFPENHGCAGLKYLQKETRVGFKLSLAKMREKGIIK